MPEPERDEFWDAMEAYKARFGRYPPVIGLGIPDGVLQAIEEALETDEPVRLDATPPEAVA